MNFIFVESSRRAWGSEQHFVSLAIACRQAGHRVVAVVRAGTDVARLLTTAGVDVRVTPFRGGGDPRALWITLKVIVEIGADWLVTDHQKHYWPLYVVAKLSGTRLAVFRHMVYVRSWLTRVLFPRLADRFFVVSDFALESLVADGAPRSHLTRLYNQIDLQRFKPSAFQRDRARQELALPTDAIIVGFVGRHEWEKGVCVLRAALDAAMTVEPRLHAIWVGGGPLWEETQSTLRLDLKDRHRFVEWTPTPELYYPAFDCLVAPSRTVETFGRVVAEAQACGVPVIATSLGGLREAFLAGTSGEYCRNGNEQSDIDALARQIVRLSNDPMARVTMGRAGRRFVRRFDSTRVVELFISHLLEADGLEFRQPQVAASSAASSATSPGRGHAVGWEGIDFETTLSFRNSLAEA